MNHYQVSATRFQNPCQALPQVGDRIQFTVNSQTLEGKVPQLHHGFHFRVTSDCILFQPVIRSASLVKLSLLLESGLASFLTDPLGKTMDRSRILCCNGET